MNGTCDERLVAIRWIFRDLVRAESLAAAVDGGSDLNERHLRGGAARERFQRHAAGETG